jgi:hypothetical protein
VGNSTWPPSIEMGVTAGIFLASIVLKEMRYRRAWLNITRLIIVDVCFVCKSKYRIPHLDIFSGQLGMSEILTILSVSVFFRYSLWPAIGVSEILQPYISCIVYKCSCILQTVNLILLKFSYLDTKWNFSSSPHI